MIHALEYRVICEYAQALLPDKARAAAAFARCEAHVQNIVYAERPRSIGTPRGILFHDGSFAEVIGCGKHTRIHTYPPLSETKPQHIPAGLVALLGTKLPSMMLVARLAEIKAEGTTQ
jgi:hypothetical protein